MDLGFSPPCAEPRIGERGFRDSTPHHNLDEVTSMGY